MRIADGWIFLTKSTILEVPGRRRRVGPDVSAQLIDHFHSLLMGMSYDDPEVQPLMELEGLKAWRDGRVQGYHILDEAVNDEHFYDASGAIVEPSYKY